MPNWAEGTLKLRGRRENVASALKEMLLGNEGATLEEEYDGTLLRFKNEYDYFYINGTRRAFISSKDIEIWLDDDFVIIELEDFKQAWAVLADNYTEILVSLMLILKFSLLKWVWNLHRKLKFQKVKSSRIL
ncbi:Uncharacterised protein [Streptococcus pneumoniae]|nr:Uncharacterised protein [Streptococcus pneumoniae]